MQLSVSRHISHVTLTHISHHRDNIFPVALGLAAAGLQHLVQGCWGMWAAWPGITQWPTAHLLQLCICNVTIRAPGIVFSLFYGPIVHLSQQLTHCLCVARLLGHCLLCCACTRAILTDEVFCHRQLGGECAQSWTRVKAPELGAPRLCARCVRVITIHCTVTTADGLRLGTLDTELPQGGNNRAWPFLGAVFYRKYCVETCQTIWRTWPGLALSSGGAVGSYS